jgi:hypothetical protein
LNTRPRPSRYLAVALLGWLFVGCATSSSTSPSASVETTGATTSPSALSSPSPSPSPSANLSALPSDALTWRQLALADDANGTMTLWTFNAADGWQALRAMPDATAIARDGDIITIARGASLEIRTAVDPGTVTSTVHPKWTGTAPNWTIVALDRSPGGKTAIVLDTQCPLDRPTPAPTCAPDVVKLAVVAPDGSASYVTSARVPEWMYAPYLAWLDDRRLLMLVETGGLDQAAIFDTQTGNLTTYGSDETCCVAVSSDRMTAAFAILSFQPSLFVLDVSKLADLEKAPAIPSGDLQGGNVWALALDTNGTHLGVVEALYDAQDKRTGFQERVFAKTGSQWQLVMTAPMPFGPDDFMVQSFVWLI